MASLGDWDVAVYRMVHEGWKSPILDIFMIAITITGLGWVQAILLAGSGFASKWWRTILWVASCAVLSGILRPLIVALVGRLRPSNLSFSHAMENVYGRTSFPSGHTSGAFAIATGLLLFLPADKRWIGWAAMIWAAGVGISRIYVGVHYPTDVIAGAAFGVGSALLVWLLSDRLGLRSERGQPEADNNFAGP